MDPESACPGSTSHIEHIFSAIFNLSFLEEVFVSFMIQISFILFIIEIFLNIAMETKLVNLVPLNGRNYATWYNAKWHK